MTTRLEQRVDALCEAVMHAVAAGIRDAGRKVRDYQQATDVVRQEIKDLLFGERYAVEREALRLRSVSDQTVIASVVASCLTRIEYQQKEA